MRKRSILTGIMVFVLGFFTLGLITAEAELEVYDSTGQFLGVNIFSTPDGYEAVFIPSLCKFMVFAINYNNLTIYCPNLALYTTSDCSGTAFVGNAGTIISTDWAFDRYYVPKWPLNKHAVPAKTYAFSWTGECTELIYDVDFIYEAERISIPFQLPGKYPYRYKYNQSITLGGPDNCGSIPTGVFHKNRENALVESTRHPTTKPTLSPGQ